MAGPLFGSAATGPGSTGGVKHLVEMRAGRMTLKGRMVHPDKRKGLLYIFQSEDSLMHFCWQDRQTGVVEDDLIIFPDDCEYVRVTQCTTGRVYVLKFKSSNRRLFFWMQEPRTDRDEENCKRINEYLNNPPGNISSGNGTDQDLQSLLNNMSQQQLMSLFGGVNNMGGLSSLLGTMSRPSTGARSGAGSGTPAITHRPAATAAAPAAAAASPTPAAAAAPTTPTGAVAAAAAAAATAAAGMTTPQNMSVPTASTNAPVPARSTTTATAASPILLTDLQNFLQGITPATTDQSVDLSTDLNADALSGLLSNAEAIEALQSHLPPVDGTTQEQLRSTLQSPQFQQAVSQFSSALQSGQLGPVVSQLEVNPDAVAAAAQGNMREFVRALERTTISPAGAAAAADKDKKKKDPPAKKDSKPDEDDEMQLD